MIRIFFGSPGVGKTTLATKFLLKYRRRYKHCYGNYEHTVPGAAVCDLDGLGEWTFPKYSYIAVDEAGIEYNSRAYKTMLKKTIAWYKKHRHYRCDLDVFSQAWDDMDISIRRLTNQLWYMYRIGPFTLCRRVYKRCTVDKNTEQIIDGYKMASMFWLLVPFLWWFKIVNQKFMLCFRPLYYKYFDSYSCDDLPVKDFPVNPEKKRKRVLTN